MEFWHERVPRTERSMLTHPEQLVAPPWSTISLYPNFFCLGFGIHDFFALCLVFTDPPLITLVLQIAGVFSAYKILISVVSQTFLHASYSKLIIHSILELLLRFLNGYFLWFVEFASNLSLTQVNTLGYTFLEISQKFVSPAKNTSFLLSN